VAVQRKLREVFGSRDSAGSLAGRWTLEGNIEFAGVFYITTALILLLLTDTRNLEHFKQTQVP